MNVKNLKKRYARACTLSQTLDRGRLIYCLRSFFSDELLTIEILETSSQLDRNAAGNAWVDSNQPQAGTPKTRSRKLTEEYRQARMMFQLPRLLDANISMHDLSQRGFCSAYSTAFDGAAYWHLANYAEIVIKAATSANTTIFERWLPLFEAFEAGGLYIWPLEDRISVATLPDMFHSDDLGRLHSTDGPAFFWRDVALYFWHGHQVNEENILRPHTVSEDQIRAERNHTRRGVLWNATHGISKVGWQRLPEKRSDQRIERLTPVQESLLPQYLAKWKAITHSTEPADRPLAEQGIRHIYESAKLMPPRIIWTTSPKASAEAYKMTFSRNLGRNKIIREGDEGGDYVRSNIYDLQTMAYDNVRDSLVFDKHHDVYQIVWEGLAKPLLSFNKTEGLVYSSLDRLRWIWEELGRKPMNVTDPFDARPRNCVYGQHDASSLAGIDYFREVCGLVNETEPLLGHIMVAQAANWWLACLDICFISERPNHLYYDESGQLHREDGPAVEYPDGWGAFCWHGVPIPASDQRLRISST